jgi:hypothetical protein
MHFLNKGILKCPWQGKGREKGLGRLILLSSFKSFQPFEKSIFKQFFACAADFWQSNFVLFQSFAEFEKLQLLFSSCHVKNS